MSPSTHAHKDSWSIWVLRMAINSGPCIGAINWKCGPRCFSTLLEEVLSTHVTPLLCPCKRHRLEETFLLHRHRIGRRFSPLNVNSTIRKGNFSPSRFRVLCTRGREGGILCSGNFYLTITRVRILLSDIISLLFSNIVFNYRETKFCFATLCEETSTLLCSTKARNGYYVRLSTTRRIIPTK